MTRTSAASLFGVKLDRLTASAGIYRISKGRLQEYRLPPRRLATLFVLWDNSNPWVVLSAPIDNLQFGTYLVAAVSAGELFTYPCLGIGTVCVYKLGFGTEKKCTRAMIVESAMTVLQRLHQGYFSNTY